MKRIMFSAVVAAMFALGAYTLAGAQGRSQGVGPKPDGGGRPGAGGGALMMLRGLDLSDSQREQIRAFVEAQRAAAGGVRVDGQLQRQLQAELFADAPDSQRVAELQQQIAQAHSAGLAREITLSQQIAQVLTAEQRHAVRERLARVPERREAGGRGQSDAAGAPRPRGQVR